MTRIINKRIKEPVQKKKLRQPKEDTGDCVKKHQECKNCKCTFSTESSLAIHCKIHNGKPYRCRMCGDYFTHNKVLEKHMKSHSERKMHTCPECDKQFGKLANLKMHLNIHTGVKPYKCTEIACGATFAHVSSLKTHVDITHKGNCKETALESDLQKESNRPTPGVTSKKMHSCPICNKMYISSLSLEFHITHHIGSKPFVCTKAGCLMDFEDEATLKNHVVTVHREKQSTVKLSSSKRFQKFKTTQGQKHSKSERHKCSYCNKEFLASTNLQVHMNRHFGLKPYKCKLGWCSASFADAGSLRRHKLTVHKGNMPFKCLDCTAAFKRELCLQEHMEKFHVGTKPKLYKSKTVLEEQKALSLSTTFTCGYCKAEFCNRGVMLKHVRLSHGNVKLVKSGTLEATERIRKRKKDIVVRKNSLYSCDQCHVKFKRQGVLQNHVKRVHQAKLQRQPGSSSKTAPKQDFKLQKAVEVGPSQTGTFKCTQCSAKFKKEGFLRNHVEHCISGKRKVETRGRPSKSSLKCEQCGLAFNRKMQLMDHNKRVHKKQLQPAELSKSVVEPKGQGNLIDGVRKKILKCKQCRAEFQDKMNLLAHIRSNHGTVRSRKFISKAIRKESVGLQKPVSGILSDKNVVFKCEQCSFEFKYQVDLLKHVRSIHSSDMVVKLPDKSDVASTVVKQRHFVRASFKCELCSAAFHLRRKLTKHVRIAHRQKQYKCDKCDRTFKRQSHLQKHPCGSGNEEAFVYKCEQCTAEFTKCKDLLEHVRLHSDDIFDTCEEVNLISSEYIAPDFSDVLQSNIKQEYQHECGKCGDLFVDRKSLHSHLLIHAAERG